MPPRGDSLGESRQAAGQDVARQALFPGKNPVTRRQLSLPWQRRYHSAAGELQLQPLLLPEPVIHWCNS